jgi:quercetin dioxygenase-like cupin family protein
VFVYARDCKEEILENGVRRRVKGWTDDLMAVELTWNKGMTGEVHTHPHRQCGYVLSGSFEAVVDGEKAVLRAGDCFYAQANQPHGLTALEDASVCLDIFTPHREDFAQALKGGAQ